MNPWPPDCGAWVGCRLGDPYWDPQESSVLKRCYRCGHPMIVEQELPAAHLSDLPRWEYCCVPCAAAITGPGTEWRHA